MAFSWQGLKDYQDEVDENKEKLQVKLEGRMEKIQGLILARQTARNSIPKYGAEISFIQNRLGDVEGGETFMTALGNDPTQAKAVKDYIQSTENFNGYQLSGSEILDVVTVLSTQDAGIIEGFRTTADLLEASKGKALLDNDTYFDITRDAMNINFPTGSTVLDFKPAAKVNKPKIDLQNKFLESGVKRLIGEAMDEVKTTGQSSYGNETKLKAELNKIKLDGLDASPQIMKKYGPAIVAEALNGSENMFNNVLQMNPTYSKILRDYIPAHHIEKLQDEFNAGRLTSLDLFNNKFGRGSAQFILGISN